MLQSTARQNSCPPSSAFFAASISASIARAEPAEVTPEACTIAPKASAPARFPASESPQLATRSFGPVRPDRAPISITNTLEVKSCAPANITIVRAIGKTAPSSSLVAAECAATNGEIATSSSTSPIPM
nr:hypothetical protein [Streptomyces sp. WM6378]